MDTPNISGNANCPYKHVKRMFDIQLYLLLLFASTNQSSTSLWFERRMNKWNKNNIRESFFSHIFPVRIKLIWLCFTAVEVTWLCCYSWQTWAATEWTCNIECWIYSWAWVIAVVIEQFGLCNVRGVRTFNGRKHMHDLHNAYTIDTIKPWT